MNDAPRPTLVPGSPDWSKRRLSFGAQAPAYDRYRPGYPPQALAWMTGGRQAADVVDLATGTGRLGAVAVAAGHRVVGVEPDPGMRAVAEQVLPVVLDGSAEQIPLPDASADVVTVAQAWHWVDRERALPELARVLRPGGTLAVVWNIRDDREPWVAALGQLIGGEDGRWREREHGPELGEAFGPVEEAEFDHVVSLDRPTLVGLVDTFSYVALNPDRERVLEAVAALPDSFGLAEVFDLPYRLRCYRAARL